ncbi:signal peptidase I [Nocardioides nitrophenolicus]|uniref:signal peptidase I n=1 Tax=Nocardioides nitrophenolicus TaxID=60489 RepID=UPI00195E9BC4|nr:signal peptidase I [Nocardioides nitrophenolicus]MBM7520170.1 signal peptidase [Nocardioides nitrophenolicus]
MTSTTRVAREALLWVGGILGALCLLSLLAGWALQATPLVFSSASMSPAYDAGALGIARQVDATDLAVGDVVSVHEATGSRVTHRVVAIEARGKRALLTLRGDANEVPDAQTYLVGSADRVVLGVPYAGYVLNAAASPFGLAAAAVVATGALLAGFGRGRRLVPVGLVATVVAGVGLGATGVTPWAFTSAYWTDSAKATVTATAPAGPVISCVRNANETITLSWTKTNSAYTYDWIKLAPGGGATSSNDISPTSGSGLGAATAVNGTVSFTLTSTKPGTTSWDIVVTTKQGGSALGSTTQQIGAQGSHGLYCSYQN